MKPTHHQRSIHDINKNAQDGTGKITCEKNKLLAFFAGAGRGFAEELELDIGRLFGRLEAIDNFQLRSLFFLENSLGMLSRIQMPVLVLENI